MNYNSIKFKQQNIIQVKVGCSMFCRFYLGVFTWVLESRRKGFYLQADIDELMETPYNPCQLLLGEYMTQCLSHFDPGLNGHIW